ncbi:MAG: Fe-S cluster assembly ATP-binding protein [Parcubacteria group bacterium Gr01-1014_38]|nr:MAG: Fe-S cluster assembly ATP-binding protein [Parcubacteria group bacterium Gr01-1014_38]
MVLHGSRMLSIRNLHASVEGKEILRGVSLDVRPGEVVALMGPNGSGKSTLAFALMGHPNVHVTGGTATYQGRDLLALKPEERAKLGLFLSFQYPHEIPGVPLSQMLRTAVGQRSGTLPPVREFLQTLDGKLALLKMDPSFAERNVNEGFSGGEKKRAEILQLAVLEPTLAMLDETDSGLDVDALRTVAEGIQTIKRERPEMAVLLITHYERFLDFLTPNRVLVMKEGKIVAEGGKDLADRIQQEGYEPL